MTDRNNKPDYNVYVVTQTGGKSFWHKVGATWQHTKSEGMNIRLEFPVGATELVLLPPKEDA